MDTASLPVSTDTNGDDEGNTAREEGEEEGLNEDEDESEQTTDKGEDGCNQVGDEASDGLEERDAARVGDILEQNDNSGQHFEDELCETSDVRCRYHDGEREVLLTKTMSESRPQRETYPMPRRPNSVEPLRETMMAMAALMSMLSWSQGPFKCSYVIGPFNPAVS